MAYDTVTRINDGDKVLGPETPVTIYKPNGAGVYTSRGSYEVDSFSPSNSMSRTDYTDGNKVWSGSSWVKATSLTATIVVQLATTAVETPDRGDVLKYRFADLYPFRWIVTGVNRSETAGEETKVSLEISQLTTAATTVKINGTAHTLP